MLKAQMKFYALILFDWSTVVCVYSSALQQLL